MALAFPKPSTPRSSAFLDLVRSRPCALCGATEVQAHHFTTGGMGLKGSDYYAAAMCTRDHAYNVRDGNRRCFPGMSHGESMAVLWKAAAECLAFFVEGGRRKR